MPCSGEKSATSFTPGALWNRSIVLSPSRSRPVWFVIRPTRLSLSSAKPSRLRTSMPLREWETEGGRDGGFLSLCLSVSLSLCLSVSLPYSLSDRGGDDRRHSPAQRTDVRRMFRIEFRVDAIAQKNYEGLARRVDPQSRACKPGVAEAPHRKQVASIGRISREDVPTDAARRAVDRVSAGGRRIGHSRHSHRTQYPRALKLAPVQDHLAIDRQVVSGRKQSGVPGDSAEQVCSRVMNLSTHPFFAAFFGRSDARRQTGVGFVAGVFHPERAEDVLGRELVDGFAAHALYQLGQDNVVDVGINEFRSGFGQWREFPNVPHRLLRPLLVILDVVVGDQSRPVSEQLFDSDVLLARLAEFGDVARDGVAEPDQPALDQDHH